MTTIETYLIKTSKNEIIVSPEELRLIILNSALNESTNIREIFSDNRVSNRQITHNELNSAGGLILWYRSQQDASDAYTEIIQLAANNLPPVSFDIELAYLSGFEMNYCLALRGYSVFESVIEEWLKKLGYKNVEEEIEQGIMVFDYYSEHAKIIQSTSFTSALAPRRIEELHLS